MNGRLHLHLVCGPYHLAVDAERVAEVRREPGAALLVTDLRRVLAVPEDGPGTHVVLAEGDRVLAVDRVAGMVRAAAGDFAPLPPGLRRIALFDAVLLPLVDGHQLLRLAAGQPTTA